MHRCWDGVYDEVCRCEETTGSRSQVVGCFRPAIGEGALVTKQGRYFHGNHSLRLWTLFGLGGGGLEDWRAVSTSSLPTLPLPQLRVVNRFIDS